MPQVSQTENETTQDPEAPAPKSTLIRTASPSKLKEPGRFMKSKTLSTLEIPAVRAEMLKKVVPSSLVPMATANGMLILGATKKDIDCSFNLPRYLIWTGSISLSLVIIGTIGRYIVRWILENNKVRPGDKIIIWILEALGVFLIVSQVAILFSGTLIIFPRLPYWQHQSKHLPNYCDFGMVVFMTIFLIIAWSMLLLALFSAIYIICYSNRKEKPKDYRITRTYFFEERP